MALIQNDITIWQHGYQGMQFIGKHFGHFVGWCSIGQFYQIHVLQWLLGEMGHLFWQFWAFLRTLFCCVCLFHRITNEPRRFYRIRKYYLEDKIRKEQILDLSQGTSEVCFTCLEKCQKMTPSLILNSFSWKLKNIWNYSLLTCWC